MSGTDKKSNVINVPPRRKLISYKGLHGWIEYEPRTKKWNWSFKAQFVINHQGQEDTEAKAELEIKKYMDVSSKSKNIQSID